MKKNKNNFNFSKVAVIILMALSLQLSAYAADGGLIAKAQKALNSKILVPIAAGIGTVYSGMLFKAADEQEKEAEKNIKKINKIMEVFADSYAHVCQSRDDLKVPKCYCLNADGSKNTNRSNSQTCQTYWASDDYNLFAKATNYQEQIYNSNPTGCIDQDSNFDENCNCRKLISTTTGENACKKVTSVSANTEGSTTITQLKGLKDIENLANQAAQGTASLSDLSETTLKTNAIANKNYADAIIKKLNSKSEIMPVINENNVGKYADSILSASGKKEILASNTSAINAAGSMGSLLENANKNLENAQNKFKESSNNASAVTSATGSSRSKKKEEFVLSSDGEAAVVNGFAEASPEKNYKYKNSDISTNSEASIFEIINNRYVQSGLKRLFDIEEKK